METWTFIASGAILPQRELTRIVNEVSDDVVGFGPIEFLLKNPDVTEVMVSGPDDVYVERRELRNHVIGITLSMAVIVPFLSPRTHRR